VGHAYSSGLERLTEDCPAGLEDGVICLYNISNGCVHPAQGTGRVKTYRKPRLAVDP